MQMLGLQGRRTYTDSEVNTAYDDLMRAPMEEGYSEAVLAGRRELLNAVREQVISLKGSPNKEAAAVVPMALLPSALVILVEVCRLTPGLPHHRRSATHTMLWPQATNHRKHPTLSSSYSCGTQTMQTLP